MWRTFPKKWRKSQKFQHMEENTLTLTNGFFAIFSTIRIINWNFLEFYYKFEEKFPNNGKNHHSFEMAKLKRKHWP